MRRTALLLLVLLTAGSAEAGEAAGRLATAERRFGERDYAAALEEYRRAAEAAAVEGDRSIRVEALAQTARMYSATGRLEEGRAPLAEAAALARPDEPLGWTRYLGVRGIFEREDGDAEKALATFRFMYGESMRLELPRRGIDAAHHAAIVAPPGQAVEWSQLGIRAAEALGSEGWLAVLWNNLGATYDWDRRDYAQAAACYEKARYFHHLGGDEHRMMVADWALGRAAVRSGDLARAGALLPGALATARSRQAEAPSKEGREWVGNTAWTQGELLAAEGRETEALALMREARTELVAAGIEGWWADGLAELDAQIAELAR